MASADVQKNKIRERWQKLSKNEEEKLELMRNEALQRAYKIAGLLNEKYGLSGIYLYGSLAFDGRFDMHSDIDIYIADWDDGMNYWSMYNEVEEMARPYRISIATQKDAIVSMKEHVLGKGILLV
jgi:uncharacterized protein